MLHTDLLCFSASLQKLLGYPMREYCKLTLCDILYAVLLTQQQVIAATASRSYSSIDQTGVSTECADADRACRDVQTLKLSYLTSDAGSVRQSFVPAVLRRHGVVS